MVRQCFDFKGDIHPKEKSVHVDDGLDTIVVPALKDDPTRNTTLIFIHGLGGSGNQNSPIVDKWRAKYPYMKCIYPSANKMPVSMNYGMVLPAWFDVLELGTRVFPKDGWAGMLDSTRRLRMIVLEEIAKGTPPERIILAGFSQGSAMTFATAFNTDIKLGGIISLSGFYYIPVLLEAREHILTNVNRDIPIFLGHGEKDSLINVEALHCTRDAFSHAKTGVYANITTKIYPTMDHTVIAAEHQDVIEFLNTNFPYMSEDYELTEEDLEKIPSLQKCKKIAAKAYLEAQIYPEIPTSAQISDIYKKAKENSIVYKNPKINPKNSKFDDKTEEKEKEKKAIETKKQTNKEANKQTTTKPKPKFTYADSDSEDNGDSDDDDNDYETDDIDRNRKNSKKNIKTKTKTKKNYSAHRQSRCYCLSLFIDTTEIENYYDIAESTVYGSIKFTTDIVHSILDVFGLTGSKNTKNQDKKKDLQKKKVTIQPRVVSYAPVASNERRERGDEVIRSTNTDENSYFKPTEQVSRNNFETRTVYSHGSRDTNYSGHIVSKSIVKDDENVGKTIKNRKIALLDGR